MFLGLQNLVSSQLKQLLRPGGELFHNARQVEAERQQLFMRKQQQASEQEEEEAEQEVRIPAPWDTEVTREEEPEERLSPAAPPVGEGERAVLAGEEENMVDRRGRTNFTSFFNHFSYMCTYS